MMEVYTRLLNPHNHSFFLLGPRGVGKSTWVLEHYQPVLTVDLLKTEVFLKYQGEPQQFRRDIEALPNSGWIFVDEIQKLPILLDEVHSLIESKNNKRKFILTGSSARKLKRSGANLLAGRAHTLNMFPLTSQEIGTNFDLESSLKFGNLPLAVGAEKEKIRFLESYCETYLKEEIQQEALVKNLSSFSRFLKVMSILNGQKVNMAGIGREAGVQRPTVQGYVQILIDTLTGTLLRPIQMQAKVKEVDHPKFYFFDTGVVRTLQNQLRDELDSVDTGFLLETMILNELKAFSAYRELGFEFYYWATSDGKEVDFILSRGKKKIGIEVKASKKYRTEYSAYLKLLLDSKKVNKGICIYLGNEVIEDKDVLVVPVNEFIKNLEFYLKT